MTNLHIGGLDVLGILDLVLHIVFLGGLDDRRGIDIAFRDILNLTLGIEFRGRLRNEPLVTVFADPGFFEGFFELVLRAWFLKFNSGILQSLALEGSLTAPLASGSLICDDLGRKVVPTVHGLGTIVSRDSRTVGYVSVVVESALRTRRVVVVVITGGVVSVVVTRVVAIARTVSSRTRTISNSTPRASRMIAPVVTRGTVLPSRVAVVVVAIVAIVVHRGERLAILSLRLLRGAT
jgi:hypothetical protein